MQGKTRKQLPEIQTLFANRSACSQVIASLTLAGEKMEQLLDNVAADASAVQMLAEIQMVKTYLREASSVLLNNHLHHCVIWAIRSDEPEQIEAALAELITLFALTNRTKY